MMTSTHLYRPLSISDARNDGREHDGRRDGGRAVSGQQGEAVAVAVNIAACFQSSRQDDLRRAVIIINIVRACLASLSLVLVVKVQSIGRIPDKR